jgi:hypothetical protein
MIFAHKTGGTISSVFDKNFTERVEHVIGSIKRYRTVKDECRLRKHLFVEKVFTTCGIYKQCVKKLIPMTYFGVGLCYLC